MKVIFLMDVTWTDDSVKKDTIMELGDVLANKFLAKGYVKAYKEPVKEPKVIKKK